MKCDLCPYTTKVLLKMSLFIALFALFFFFFLSFNEIGKTNVVQMLNEGVSIGL